MSLYMFRALNAHLQEEKKVYMQYMVMSLSTRVRGGLSSSVLAQIMHRQATTNSRREWRYHMLHVYSVSSWRWAFKAL